MLLKIGTWLISVVLQNKVKSKKQNNHFYYANKISYVLFKYYSYKNSFNRIEENIKFN